MVITKLPTVIFHWLDEKGVGSVTQAELARGVSRTKTMLVNAVAKQLRDHPNSYMNKTQSIQMTRSLLNTIPESEFRTFLQEIIPGESISKEDWIKLSQESPQL